MGFAPDFAATDPFATGLLATDFVFDFGADFTAGDFAVGFFAAGLFAAGFLAAGLPATVGFFAATAFFVGALAAVFLTDLPVDFTADVRRPALFFSGMAAILQDRC